MLGPKSGTADHFVTNPDQIWDSPDPRSCHPPAHPPTTHLPPLTHNLAKYPPSLWFPSLPISRGLWSGCLPCTVEINWNNCACCISRLLHVSWICKPGKMCFYILFSRFLRHLPILSS